MLKQMLNKIIKHIRDREYMHFDNVLGNPPYQDGTQEGGQNKIYNQICKKALLLLTDDGIMSFITPTSVLKKNKRFSIIDYPGLTSVDYTANDYFDVGVNICNWTINKQLTAERVEVINQNGIDYFNKGDVICNYADTNREFAPVYNALKNVTDTPKKRMFKQNAVDTKTGRRKQKDNIFKFPIYKLINGKISDIIQYNKPEPKFHNKLKFIISMTKGFNDSACIVSTEDFDVAHMCIDIQTESEVNNIKSFIFSDYFKEHSAKWKIHDGYGYNYALKHLPPFDKTKSWTNDEVKEFLESFVERI